MYKCKTFFAWNKIVFSWSLDTFRQYPCCKDIYIFVFWRMWKSSKSFKHFRIYQYAILPRIPGSDASVFMECFRRSWLHCDNQGSAYNLFLHKLKWPGLFNGERYKIFVIECDARNETFVFWQGYFKDRDACKENECFDRNTTDTWLVLFLNFLNVVKFLGTISLFCTWSFWFTNRNPMCPEIVCFSKHYVKN